LPEAGEMGSGGSNLYGWFLTAVKWIASLACGLCLAGAITLAALQVVAMRLWVGAALCFVIFVVATNLERANLQKRFED
jgi:hypothetical protein